MEMEVKVQTNVNLSQFTTYGVGGPARYFAYADNWPKMFALREFARQKKIPWILLGGGSNVLFSDKGYPGLVIINQMDKIRFHGRSVTAESGVNMAKLVLIAAQHNLGGISGLANIPGSIGGAVYGNAGIPDVWIGNVIDHIEILPSNGNKPIIVGQDYCKFAYRTSWFKKTKDIILSATLNLMPMPGALVKSEVATYVKERALKQPVGQCCGSFFKNPGHFPSAGWLIEQAGCKGMKVGGAQVSEKHANFIMNTGKATASDILKLAKKVHAKVKEKHGTELEPEVQIFAENLF